MLKHKAASGFFWLTLGSGSQQLISLLVFLFLTWRLSPEDFGIVALAAVFVEFLTILACFGQMELVQQRSSPNMRTASTSFWLCQGLGLLATVGLVLAAPLLAAWMRTPKLDTYLLLLSPAILLTTLGQVHEGLIRREMRYRPLAARNVAATIVSGLAAVATVAFGRTELALVAQKLGYVVTMTAALWIFLPWRPQFRVSIPVARWLLPRGFHIMSANASSQQNARIVDFIVGLMLGTYWLGQLKIAWRLFDFIGQIAIVPFSNVALSLFAITSSSPQRLARAFVEMVKVMALVSCPVFLGLAALAPDLTRFVLGPKWADATILIQLLALLPLAAVMNSLSGPLLIAAGRTGQMLMLGLTQNMLTALIALATAPFGAAAVMIGHGLRAYLLSAIALHRIVRSTAVTVSEVLAVVAPPALASVLMGLAVIAAREWLVADLAPGLRLLVLTGIGGITYTAVLVVGEFIGLWPAYLRRTITEVMDMIRSRKAAGQLKEAHE